MNRQTYMAAVRVAIAVAAGVALACTGIASSASAQPTSVGTSGAHGRIVVSVPERSGDQARLALVTMRADGTHRFELTHPDWGYEDRPGVWSPDGRWIAFSRFIGSADDPENESVSAMFLVRPDGSGLHRITSYDLMVDEKDWSPDGRMILFNHSTFGGNCAELRTMRPDGSHVRQLADPPVCGFWPDWTDKNPKHRR